MDQATPDDKPEAHRPVNWYSGWRLFAMAAAAVLGAKLLGLVGTVVAVLVFHWLSRKRGAGVATAGAIAAGVLTAVVYSAVLLPQMYPQQAQPAAQVAPSAEQGQWIPAPPNLKPFDGKLDGEK